MAVEYTANAVQTVADNRNVIFTDTVIGCKNGLVLHDNGSGIFTLRGITSQCRARYRVSFGGNIAVAAGGTVGAVSLALAVNGEAVTASAMTVTPAAVGNFFNVSTDAFIDVPCGCCLTVSIVNISGTPVDVQNARVIIDRAA